MTFDNENYIVFEDVSKQRSDCFYKWLKQQPKNSKKNITDETIDLWIKEEEEQKNKTSIFQDWDGFNNAFHFMLQKYSKAQIFKIVEKTMSFKPVSSDGKQNVINNLVEFLVNDVKYFVTLKNRTELLKLFSNNINKTSESKIKKFFGKNGLLIKIFKNKNINISTTMTNVPDTF